MRFENTSLLEEKNNTQYHGCWHYINCTGNTTKIDLFSCDFLAGFMAVRHYEFMLGRTMKAMYCDFLVDNAASIPLKCQV